MTAVLSRAIIHGEPDVYHMYSQKSLTWNGITQQNRNGLLWDKTMNVDGLKTGHTSGAGFNLIASAVDGQRRLIAVVMGADSPKGREQQAAKLLHWGQQNFDTVQVLQKGQKVGTERIWYGDKEQIKLGTDQDFWLALPKAEVSRIKAKYVLDKRIWRRRSPPTSGSARFRCMTATRSWATIRWSPSKASIKAGCSRE